MRHYERLTNSSIEYFEVPNAQQLSEHRQQQLLTTIRATLEQENHQPVEQLLQKWLQESDLSAEQIALALLKQQHKQRPLFLKEDRIVRERPERGERTDRADRGDRKKAWAGPNDADFDTYKIQVGREHGARPGDIVGAIANEASMDSRFIGQIQLFDQHSLVQLPKGLPGEVVKVLKKARVRQQPILLELTSEQVRRAHVLLARVVVTVVGVTVRAVSAVAMAVVARARRVALTKSLAKANWPGVQPRSSGQYQIPIHWLSPARNQYHFDPHRVFAITAKSSL